MTIKFNADRLAGLGYRGLTKDQYNELNSELYTTTEELVGIRLADEMTVQQLDAFEKYFDAGDDVGAFKWLEREFPHYRTIVEEVVAELDALLERTARELQAPFRITEGMVTGRGVIESPRSADPD